MEPKPRRPKGAEARAGASASPSITGPAPTRDVQRDTGPHLMRRTHLTKAALLGGRVLDGSFDRPSRDLAPEE